MKILFVVHVISPEFGGLSESLPKLARALARNGHHVDIVATNAGNKESLSCLENHYADNPTINLKLLSYVNAFGLKFSLALMQWLKKNTSSYDIIHIHGVNNFPSVCASTIARKQNVPYIVSPHGMLLPWAFGHKGLKKKLYFKIAQKNALKHAAGIHTLTEAETNVIQRLAVNDNTFCIPNGVERPENNNNHNSELFHQEFPGLTHKKIILYLGRLHPIKGVDVLLRAFEVLCTHINDIHLVLAGLGPDEYKKRLLDSLSHKRTKQHITLAGFLSPKLKAAALNAADAFVLPSHSEGLSIAMLEALASGTPTIISEGCNFPQATTHDMALVAKTEPDDLANNLQKILSQPDLANRLSTNAQRVMRSDFSWENIAERFILRYEKTILPPARSNH